MNIKEFSLNLQKVYDEMSEVFGAYQKSTGLDCLSGCGRCCLNPEVEASLYEMIPLALKIVSEGKADEWLVKLEQTSKNTCLLFVPTGAEGEGKCGSYSERPAVCRMFGVAGARSKHREVTLSICKYIRNDKRQLAEKAEQNLGIDVPNISDWFSKLVTLHPGIQKKLPINLAIIEALKKVVFLSQYSH